MSHIADRQSMGFPPLRHNEAAVEIGTRNVVYGLAVKDGNADLSGISEEQSVGDLNGAALWRASDKGKRPHPGWSFAWAAQTALPERQKGGSSSSGGGGGGSGKPTVDHNGLTPYGAKPSATPAAGFASFRNADGSDPFKFFGAHTGPLGLIRQEDFGLFGVQPKGTQLGLIKQEGFGIFGAQPKGTALSGMQVNGAGGAVPGTGESNPVASAGTTVSGKPVTDNASDADPTAGAGALPTGSGQSNGAGGAGGAGGSSSVGGGGGGIAGAPASVLPTFDANHRLDDRYGLKPANEPPWASKRPRGWPGVVMAGSNEDVQEDVFIPAGSALVSANAPEADPTLSTAVVDVTKEGAVDIERRVPLGDFVRVVHDPIGLGNNALSWVMSPTASYAPRLGGLVTDLDNKAASGTVARNGPVPIVHASMSARHGGPLDTGDSDDPHEIGTDADGNKIKAGHISGDALVLKRGIGDGPWLLEAGGYPEAGAGGAAMRVHIVFDPNTRLGSSRSASPGETPRQLGVWRAYAESPIDDDAPPPDDPPRTPTPDPGGGDGPPDGPPGAPPTGGGGGRTPPGGDPRRKKTGKPRRVTPLGPDGEQTDDPGKLWGGPDFPEFPEGGSPPEYIAPTTTRGRPRPLAQTHREIAFPAIVIKPQGFGCGTRDLRNDQRGDAAAQAKHRREDPAILRIEGAWAKAGGDCNAGIPAYTNKPGNARYLGGTASGVVGLIPPEVGMEDYASGFAPPGMSVSTAHVVALKGKVFFGSGLPDPTGGLNKSGNYWDTGTSQVLEIKSTTSAGVVDKTRTLPNRTGNIVLAPSALTSGQLVKADANGDAVDSGLKDDGTIVTVDRVTIAGATSITLRGVNVQGGSNGGAATINGGDVLDGNGGDVAGAAVFRGGDGGTDADGGAATLRGGNAAGVGTGGAISVRAGSSGSGTAGVLQLQTAGGTARLTVNTDGTVTQAGDHTFSGTLTATAKATLGNLSLSSTTQTASNGGNYAVAATIAVVYVNASGLSGTNNYDVTLPSAATYADRRVNVKITVVGTGSATVTVKSSSGTVEGVAAATGVPLDATSRSKVTYQSDGTNWWSV